MTNYTALNLAAAKALAAAGLPVFPAAVAWNENAGKLDEQPALVGWRTNATTNSAKLETWWTTWPDAVPGIELEIAGLVVLDLDRHPGAQTAWQHSSGSEPDRIQSAHRSP